MKTFTGYRTPQGCIVKAHEACGTTRDLPLRLDLSNHSPTGPEWEYAGSGPAILAFALAAAVLGYDEQAQEMYLPIKVKRAGYLPYDGWPFAEDRLHQAIQDIQERNQGLSPREPDQEHRP